MGQSDSQNGFVVLIHKLGLEDTRRLIHSLKVGLALTLASLLVLVDQPFSWIGQNAIWAVITIVVVFETSAGATLGKGLNRGLGTVVAGLLAMGAAHLADFFKEPGEPIFIGAVVFMAGTVCTFIRAIPKVKKKFDYGVVIFMITFSMVLVTGYRVGDEVGTASDRLLTIMIGGLICLFVSSLLFPHWAGEDLHGLSADNFDKLGSALEGCVKEYLTGEAQPITSKMILEQTDVDPVYNACRQAVKSRSTEESLVVFASWEPPHGQFRLGYPWKQYLTVGAMLRHCAYSVLALHGCLRSEIQAPSALRILFANELLRASQDAADLLHELGDCIRTMRKPKGSTSDLLEKITRAAADIKKSISKHSYILATPDSWAAVEDHLQEHVTVKQTLSRTEWAVPGKYKLASHVRTPSTPEGSAARSLCIHNKTELAKSFNNFDLQESFQVETESSCDETEATQAHPSMNAPNQNHYRLESHAKEGPGSNSSFKAPKLPTVLREDCALNQSGNGETESSSLSMVKAQLSSSLSAMSITNRGDAINIASALSLVTFASLLVETLARLSHVVEAVENLSQDGRFKACSCGPRRVHVEEHCIKVHSLPEDNCTVRSSSRMDRELVPKHSRSFKNSMRYQVQPTGMIQGE